MNAKPLISVIVPVYKVEPYLRKCADSLLCNTFTDFELILVDDGSPDRCGEICDEYARQDSRVHVIHQANGGLSAARNAGIEWCLCNSESKWVTFIDSDDWVTKDYLESHIHAVELTGCCLSVGGLKAIDAEGNILFEQCESEKLTDTPENIFCNFGSLATWACGKLFLKSDFRLVRFPVGKLFEDRHTTHKILFRYPVVACVNYSPYIYFFARTGNICGNASVKNALDRAQGLCCQIDYFHENGFHLAARAASLELVRWLATYGAKHHGLGDAETNEIRAFLEACRKKWWKTDWRDLEIRYTYRSCISARLKSLWYCMWICGQLCNGNVKEVFQNIGLRLRKCVASRCNVGANSQIGTKNQ